MGIGLQPQLRGIATGLRAAQLVFQVADQRALALQFQACGLQQFAQVQQVGEGTLALGAGGLIGRLAGWRANQWVGRWAMARRIGVRAQFGVVAVAQTHALGRIGIRPQICYGLVEIEKL